MFPIRIGCLLSAAALLALGCQAGTRSNSVTNEHAAQPVVHATRDRDLVQASFEPVSDQATGSRVVESPEDSSLANASELSVEALVSEVEARNPSLQGMVAAWQAAAQRYPQAIALDDPMFQTMVAPASFGSSTAEPAYALQISQKLPWYGKRAARGQAAQAETNAAGFDVEDSRVKLDEATHYAFFDYYLAQRDLELNGENSRVMREFRQTAEAKYQAGQVTQQDVLQADVELAELDRRRIELDRIHRQSVARINTLLRRNPSASLPPAPRQLGGTNAIPQVEMLEQIALERRPDLAAIHSRVEAEQSAVTLACKEYYPDVEVFGRYDTFWQPESTMGDLRGQVGINVNLPIYRGKRDAAANEAMFRLNQKRAEYQQRELDVQYEVRSAYEQLVESQRTVQLYADRIIPASVQNVAVARTNYDVAKTTFLGLAQSERQLIELREKQQEAIANYHRRLAELQRVIAGPLSQANVPAASPTLPAAPK